MLDRGKRAAMLNIGIPANVNVTRNVVLGTPYKTSIQIAAAEHVDQIVMATHGRTGLSHLVLGSVAERVVQTAPCPALTMHVAAS